MNQHPEILNLEYWYRHYAVTALNRAPTKTQAANLLGVSTRTLHRWVRQFNIQFCQDNKQFISKPIKLNFKHEHS